MSLIFHFNWIGHATNHPDDTKVKSKFNYTKEDEQESSALSFSLYFTRAQFFANHVNSQRVHSAAAS